MTIARLMLAMIPIAIVSAIAASGSPLAAGFLEAWKYAGQIFGLEFTEADFGKELPPLLFEVGVVVGMVSMLFACIAAVIAFGVAWSESGPKRNDKEQQGQ